MVAKVYSDPFSHISADGALLHHAERVTVKKALWPQRAATVVHRQRDERSGKKKSGSPLIQVDIHWAKVSLFFQPFSSSLYYLFLILSHSPHCYPLSLFSPSHHAMFLKSHPLLMPLSKWFALKLSNCIFAVAIWGYTVVQCTGREGVVFLSVSLF